MAETLTDQSAEARLHWTGYPVALIDRLDEGDRAALEALGDLAWTGQEARLTEAVAEILDRDHHEARRRWDEQG